MADTMEQIAGKVRGVAAEAGFKHQDIADTLKCSRASVVQRMAGRVPFTGAELFELSKAMRVPVSRFFPAVERQAVA